MASNNNPATYGGSADLVRRPTSDRASMPVVDSAFETHYRIGDLARLWGLGRETVRKLVKDDPGVLKIRMGRKKAHTFYSIPESEARRIHTRLLNST
jgi:hypothetical protein